MTARPRLGWLEALALAPDFRLARVWSNYELRWIGARVEGEVINVSAWEDSDKQGGRYRDYFPRARAYYTSNYGGDLGQSPHTDFVIDLEKDLDPALKGRFDVVFNHTTLEHVFDIFTAMRNLAEMSRDLVIVVVPFIQRVHPQTTFSDYWRFTHLGLAELCRRNGLGVVYLASNANVSAAIYHVCVASRYPARWHDVFVSAPGRVNDGAHIGRSGRLGRLARRLLGRFTSSAQRSGDEERS